MLRRRVGIQRPYSDLFGPAGMKFLADIELRESPRRRLDSTLSLIADFTREIDATSREIDARASEDAYVPVLCQIRGVGRYIAMLIIAEVGDIDRFANARWSDRARLGPGYQATDLSVAQAVVAEREDLAGDGDLGNLLAAALGDALVAVAQPTAPVPACWTASTSAQRSAREPWLEM